MLPRKLEAHLGLGPRSLDSEASAVTPNFMLLLTSLTCYGRLELGRPLQRGGHVEASGLM